MTIAAKVAIGGHTQTTVKLNTRNLLHKAIIYLTNPNGCAILRSEDSIDDKQHQLQ